MSCCWVAGGRSEKSERDKGVVGGREKGEGPRGGINVSFTLTFFIILIVLLGCPSQVCVPGEFPRAAVGVCAGWCVLQSCSEMPPVRARPLNCLVLSAPWAPPRKQSARNTHLHMAKKKHRPRCNQQRHATVGAFHGATVERGQDAAIGSGCGEAGRGEKLEQSAWGLCGAVVKIGGRVAL